MNQDKRTSQFFFVSAWRRFALIAAFRERKSNDI
jgi:hypothetical protein